MRKIVREVPENRCDGCNQRIFKDGSLVVFTCPFRTEGKWPKMVHKYVNAAGSRAVKACREAGEK